MTATRASQWDEWTRKQELGLREYTKADPESKAYSRRLAKEFRALCNPNGMILDVGCGIDPTPSYVAESANSNYVGIDPLIGEHKRGFHFVRAVGETLPFRTATFDWTICATSLDHFVEPVHVFTEIRRILKQDGGFALWIGVVDLDCFNRIYALPSPRSHRNWQRVSTLVRTGDLKGLTKAVWRHLVLNVVRRLRMRLLRWTIEQSLIDATFAVRAQHHFRFFREKEVLALLHESGYRIINYRLVKNERRGNSLFVKAALDGSIVARA